MKKIHNKILLTLFVVLIIEFAPRLGTYFSDIISPHLKFLDPDNVYIWGMVHHIIQALIPFLIIVFWRNKPLKEWGFQVGDYQKGLKWVAGFTLIWLLVYAILTVVNIYQAKIPQVYYDVSLTRNLLGELFFRGIIVGPSEEILFRSFPIIILIFAGWSKKSTIFGFTIPRAGIISAILFAYAHIGYNHYPFEVYRFDPFQIFTSLGFGLLYAIVFEHTRSILYPMIIHSISDVFPVLSLYIIHIALN